MRCPYCAEEIQDNAIKCKHCGEWLPGASHMHPADKTASEPTRLVVFQLSGENVKVERTEDEDIVIVHGSTEVLRIPKIAAGKSKEISLDEHKVVVQFNDPHRFLGFGAWFSGFRISVDGRPVEGTLDDPRAAIKTAGYVLFFYAFIALVGALTSSDPDEKLGGIFLLPLFLLLGLLRNRIPLLATFLGSLFGIIDVLSFAISSVESGRSGGFAVGFLIVRGGACLAMIRGLLAALRLRSLRKRFARS